MSSLPTPISQYQKTSFTHKTSLQDTIVHDIYTLGQGPPIILIQELPGIGKTTLSLADKLVAAGFQVVMPHLFGPLGRTDAIGNLRRVFCMRKEFHLFKSRQSSPIVEWLRALCRQVKEQRGVKGVGVIGMCLTGNFAIALMADEHVLAAVSSQPSMPFLKQRSLHISEEEEQAIKAKLDKEGPMIALRFEKDWMCGAKKFQRIKEVFNTDGKERVRLRVMPGKGHAVLTRDFVGDDKHPTAKALKEVITYFSKVLDNQSNT